MSRENADDGAFDGNPLLTIYDQFGVHLKKCRRNTVQPDTLIEVNGCRPLAPAGCHCDEEEATKKQDGRCGDGGGVAGRNTYDKIGGVGGDGGLGGALAGGSGRRGFCVGRRLVCWQTAMLMLCLASFAFTLCVDRRHVAREEELRQMMQHLSAVCQSRVAAAADSPPGPGKQGRDSLGAGDPANNGYGSSQSPSWWWWRDVMAEDLLTDVGDDDEDAVASRTADDVTRQHSDASSRIDALVGSQEIYMDDELEKYSDDPGKDTINKKSDVDDYGDDEDDDEDDDDDDDDVLSLKRVRRSAESENEAEKKKIKKKNRQKRNKGSCRKYKKCQKNKSARGCKKIQHCFPSPAPVAKTPVAQTPFTPKAVHFMSDFWNGRRQQEFGQDMPLKFFAPAGWMSKVYKDEEQPITVDRSGGFIVNQSGLYLIYSSVMFHDLKPRQSHAVVVNGHKLFKCMDSVDYFDTDLPDGSKQAKYKTCAMTGVTHLTKGSRLEVQNLYANTEIDLSKDATYVGAVLLSPGQV